MGFGAASLRVQKSESIKGFWSYEITKKNMEYFHPHPLSFTAVEYVSVGKRENGDLIPPLWLTLWFK